MDLLIAANTVAQEQADKAPASGTPGWATDGNPATGQLATDAPAWHYNMMMSELISIIKAAGITPSNADWSQVLKAMQTIFSPAQYGVAPYSAQLAQLVGGYPIGAVVFDADGNYWRSTQASNLSVPGADGAKWVNFFEGILTKQQADLLYLSFLGGNVTGAMDWGSKTAAATLTHRYWSAGPPAEGNATPDATLTIAGGTPGTANKGTMALSTGVFDLSASGQVLVPSIVSFDGKDALNALTAEGRYVRSVPATGGTNVRVVDVQEDAAGNLIATKSDGTTTSYAPGSYGTFTGGYWIQTGNIRQIWWSQKIHSGDTVPFPFAFASAPEVFATQTEYQDQLPQFAMGIACIDDTKTTATSCAISSLVIQDDKGSYFPAPSGGVVVKFCAVGPVS
ncbi:hypothetical protein [Acetobacter fabarum]|uniref:hypothetical protein n=1 Tax=Acetobacter fabarum TaxID=483199 RepID=UPI0020A1F68E|nr:hypothetical protein [Acetobacter fabarum]MCP1229428.1 hypothetical protein [Acetobacter fabarum]MCP1234945.1 hypothetical protein [Acetobacter fabarum]